MDGCHLSSALTRLLPIIFTVDTLGNKLSFRAGRIQRPNICILLSVGALLGTHHTGVPE